ncbi:cyclase/dehydrase [Chloroherpeton thalassium ATCC 35110]|uniref:Cyclase/dehydrase n=1 Tax=Chloroherpeton thalassium (strain ATCC 35110 / GB-78) TaxID=517418 RepID=B3QTM7_CHLT3|nr:SRPBCC family protein [Chloroherpeton thalassium]ACF12773.1 cyclase/dehydrase [Chloroherpeton thalassium ATCC 35110]
MHTLSFSVDIAAPCDAVFHFHDDVENLKQITPPEADLKILYADDPGKGQKVVLSIAQFGFLHMKWEVLITDYEPPFRMTDEQIKGPFHSWRQTRSFQSLSNAHTRLTDAVVYELPLQFFSDFFFGALVEQQITEQFKYRQAKLKAILENQFHS